MLLIKRCIFFSFLIFKHNSLAAQTDVQYCGFEHKCGRNQTNVVATEDSCCQPCECDDFCQEKNTCCADMERLDDTKESIRQQCLPAEFVPRGLRASDEYNSYYVRSRCPSNFADKVIKKQCEKPSNDNLEEIIFVSSIVENVVYRNIFCALCHGDKTTKPWTLFASSECIGLVEESDVTLSSVKKTLLTKCRMSLIEPSGLKSKPRICFDDDTIIGSCNRTGEWNEYNKTHEELCQQSSESANYYFLQTRRLIVFRNVYCYICNTKDDNLDVNKCKLSFEKNPGALSALIRQSSLTGTEDLRQKKPTTCSIDEILDTTFDKCRRLYCPRFFIPNYGQCEPYLITTFNYKVYVKFVSQQPFSKSDFLMQDLASLSVTVSNKLGFGKCDTCYFTLWLENGINETKLHEFYLQVIMAPTKMCDINYLFKELTALEMRSSNISIVLNNATIWFEALKEKRDGFNELIYNRNVKLCIVAFSTDDMSTCGKVQLGIHEYQWVLKNHANANQLLFAPGYMNGTMLVCIDMYIVEPRSAGDKAKFSLNVAFATSIIVSYWSAF